ncbi:MAG: class I SAM-dependent methyltransferase [Spirochaetes bacterium]|nr:class I SAM-dependent methyltransferase [Spirochaetota bacterium]
MEDLKSYWEERYEAEERIWGEGPSVSASMALERFRGSGARSLLVPGAGYGRNAALFARAGFAVTGIEISALACRLAGEFCPEIRMVCGSVTGYDPGGSRFDAIYCFNLLHLFLAADRERIIECWRSMLAGPGLIFCAVCSEQDAGYGRGPLVEPDTFESKPGRPVHYFTESDLRAHFKRFDILETSILRDEENHGKEGPHTHVLRYLFARRDAAA